jgi:hypothetical protein
MRRALVSVQLSLAERTVIHDAARHAGVTVSNYIRRSINAMLLADEFHAIQEKDFGHPPMRFGPAHQARMRYLRDCGLSIRQIAQRMDCSHGLVHRVLKPARDVQPLSEGAVVTERDAQ